MGGETNALQYLPADLTDGAPAGPISFEPREAPGNEELLVSAPPDSDILPDPPGLEDLYREYCHELGRLAFLLTSCREDAEDIVVDIFVALAERYDVRTLDNPLAFLRQAVVNRSRSALRHRAVVDKYAPKAIPHAASAEQRALDQLEHEEVITALRQLPAREREAIILRYYLDLSEAEIAQTMGVRPGTVKSHTARAIAALRSILTSEES